jgi:hypothetical protein
MVKRSGKTNSIAASGEYLWAVAICLIAGLPVYLTASEPFAGTLMASAARTVIPVSQLSVVAGVWLWRDRARAELFLFGATTTVIMLIVVVVWRSVHLT